MDVERLQQPPEPEYPDREEFMRRWLGVVVVGAGITLSACQPKHTGGVIAPVRPAGAPPTRLRGDIAVLPQPDPPAGEAPVSSPDKRPSL